MPSATAASSPPRTVFPAASPEAVRTQSATGTASQLADASRALWSATLSLMTAFMHTPAPAHRYLLAQRISRNFTTLSAQECFDAACRDRFDRLARRWEATSLKYAPDREPARGGVRGLLRLLF